jgi:NAD-dependent DNA ligase
MERLAAFGFRVSEGWQRARNVEEVLNLIKSMKN